VDGTELSQTLVIEGDPSLPRGAALERDEHEEDRQLDKELKRRPAVGSGD
jgi:hypothetical protein